MKRKKKTTLKTINLALFTTLISLTVYSCSNSAEKENKKSKQENQEQYADLKQEMNEVGDAMTDLFHNEQDNFKESAKEVIGDLDRNIRKYKSKLTGDENKSDMETKLRSLERKADDLESKINKADDQSEEQWAQTKEDVREKFEELKADINNLTSDPNNK